MCRDMGNSRVCILVDLLEVYCGHLLMAEVDVEGSVQIHARAQRYRGSDQGSPDPEHLSSEPDAPTVAYLSHDVIAAVFDRR
ncbi:hypothetical protein CBM2610_A80483 [Cupriavidus taiwanensis]|nr:hypothetical protein CBM2610_A80483 [Cupriavidus taiwanensis]